MSKRQIWDARHALNRTTKEFDKAKEMLIDSAILNNSISKPNWINRWRRSSPALDISINTMPIESLKIYANYVKKTFTKRKRQAWLDECIKRKRDNDNQNGATS